MRLTASYRFMAIAVFCLVATACGGGGGGIAPPPAPALLAILEARLQGDLESAVVDANARATAILELESDGTLMFACAGESGWVAEVIGAHIHRGTAGVDGPIVVDLLGAGASFDAGTWTAAGTLSIDAALAAEIASTPADFYVNVHTTAATAGLVRNQLAPLGAREVHATLLGANEVVVADADARGAATFLFGAGKSVAFRLAMSRPASADLTAAHIHAAPAGVDGPVLVDLDPTAATLDPTTGLISGTLTLSLEQIARIGNALPQFYVNAHTAAVPAGVARGQLTDEPVQFWAQLSADNETTPPTDPNGRGGAALELDSFSSGVAHLAVPPTQGIGSISDAHVHAAPAGSDGGVVMDLTSGADYTESILSFSSEGSVTCDQDLFTRLLANPAAFYFNFHTSADPGGAVRGQLTQEPVGFFAVLDGSEEVPVADPTASALGQVVVSSMSECTYNLDIGNPAATDITAAHIHDGDAGVNGPVLIDLLGGGFSVSGPSISGSTTFSGRTFARLLASAESFYVNIHTAAAPAGVARGQLSVRDESTPPAGLTYSTPVSYTEGVAIADNVPASTGGAVAGYGVSPDLPAGLVLDPLIGVISGTPTASSAAADYTVTATNASGTTTSSVNITVLPAAPANLQYTTPVSYGTGAAITANTPTNDGGAITTYSVSPALPAGLTLSTTTGVLSGTPTSPTAAANYTVTGSNAAASTTATVNITVTSTLQAPSGLSYTTPATYTTGSAITPNTPTVSGGAVASWAISGTLPAGLTFSTSTGIISGTPTAVSSAANYTVTATNAAGSTTATVNITVNLGAPTNLGYSNNPGIGYINTALATMAPTSSGGAVASYSITPAVPAGLTFNTSTGTVSGTPTVTSGSTNYTVTATNAAGSTTATITIIVY